MFTNGSAPSVDATWLNLKQNEEKNLIESSGQTLSDSVNDQVAKAVATYTAVADSYVDSGSANAYVLAPQTGFKAPAAYKNGMKIRFKATNPNTGASTVNVNGFGVKDLKKEDGITDLDEGDIVTNRYSTFVYNGTAFESYQNVNLATTSTLGASYLPKQIVISNNTTDSNNDIDFTVGNAISQDGSTQILLSSALTKRLDATWVAGNNNGGLFSGTKGNNTTYHCFVIRNSISGAVDCGFSVNLDASDIPSGYDSYKRVGSILTDGSGNIRQFTATAINGGIEMRNPQILETSSASTSYTNIAVTVPVNINVGVYLEQICDDINSPSGQKANGQLKSLYDGVVYNGDGTQGSSLGVNRDLIWTNASAQVQHKVVNYSYLESYELYSSGYFDPLNQ